MKVKVLVTQSCPTLCDPMGCNTTSFSVEFSRQEYQSGLPFSSPGDLPDPRIEPGSPTLLAEEASSVWVKILLNNLPCQSLCYHRRYNIIDLNSEGKNLTFVN